MDSAVLHHDQLLSDRHRFDLVVRDVDRRDFEPVVELFDHRAHVAAQTCVQVGQRFVEQKHARLADDGSAECDSLPLAAGEFPRPAGQQVVDFECLRDLRDAFGDLAFGRFS